MKYLITGGAGFIGTNLVQALLAMEHEVKVIDHDPKNAVGVPITMIDIADPMMYILMADADVVIHLAAQTGVAPSVEEPKLDMKVNVNGTVNVLEAAATNGVKRFILASSGTVLGNAPPPFREDLPTRPTSPYGASKLAGEAYCSAFYNTFGLETVVLRFSNVYGPWAWHKKNLFIEFIKAATKEKALHIFGDGNQTRDFIYIKDLIQAIILASTVEGIGGEVFQVASGKETSILDFLETMRGISLELIAQDVEWTHEPPRAGEAKRSYADISKAKKILGFEPRYDLITGMTETFDWYLRKYYYE